MNGDEKSNNIFYYHKKKLDIDFKDLDEFRLIHSNVELIVKITRDSCYCASFAILLLNFYIFFLSEIERSKTL